MTIGKKESPLVKYFYLVLSDIKIPHKDLFKMKQLFFSKFGPQKMDVVSFTKNDESVFKKYILSYAKLLNNE